MIVRKTYSVPAVDADCRPTTIQLSKVAVNLKDVQLGTPEIDSPEIDSPEIDSSAPDDCQLLPRTRRNRSSHRPYTQRERPDAAREAFNLAAQQEAVNSQDVAQGITEPPIITTLLSIGTSAVPAAQNGVAYNTLLLASGGVDPVSFSVTAGYASARAASDGRGPDRGHADGQRFVSIHRPGR